MLVETKQLLFNYFDIKDLGEASYVFGIQIVDPKKKCFFFLYLFIVFFYLEMIKKIKKIKEKKLKK